MIKINIQNVEEIIFKNNEIWRYLPDIRYFRDQWRLSKISPVFKAMGRKALLDFLNKVGPEHEKIISEKLGEEITIEKLDYLVVKNMELEIEDAELDLNLVSESLYSYFSTYRTKDKLYVTFWR